MAADANPVKTSIRNHRSHSCRINPSLPEPVQLSDRNVFSLLNHPFIRAMRPKHWVKNSFVLAPLFFGGKLTDTTAAIHVFACFIAFCLAASAVYLMNDILDREKDRLHPLKMRRPIASGEISIRQARWGIVLLLAPGFALAFYASFGAGLTVLGYFLLNIAYSLYLKHIVILDVATIATGFVLRVLGGALAAHVEPSRWLLIATFLVALFIALIKRRQELRSAGISAEHQRSVLSDYSPGMIDLLLAIVTPATFFVYLAYTLDPETIDRLSAPHLYLTSVFVLFGLLRYVALTFGREQGESPVAILFNDRTLQFTVLLWAGMFAWIVYN